MSESIYDIIAHAESSGGANIWGPQTTSGQAEGLYQITTGTWQDFAPRAGVSLAQYPEPNDAPEAVQTAVASGIPLSRWAPSTVAAVQAQYGPVDTSETLGQLAGGAAPALPGTSDPYGSIGPDGSYVPGNINPSSPSFGTGPGASVGAGIGGFLSNPLGALAGALGLPKLSQIEELAIRALIALVAALLIGAGFYLAGHRAGVLPAPAKLAELAA